MDHTAIARPFSDQERPFVPPTAKDGDPIRKRIQRAMFQVYTSVGRLRSDQIDVTEAFLVVFRRGWLAAATGHPGHTSDPEARASSD